jgi:hypothetical protein
MPAATPRAGKAAPHRTTSGGRSFGSRLIRYARTQRPRVPAGLHPHMDRQRPAPVRGLRGLVELGKVRAEQLSQVRHGRTSPDDPEDLAIGRDELLADAAIIARGLVDGVALRFDRDEAPLQQPLLVLHGIPHLPEGRPAGKCHRG